MKLFLITLASVATLANQSPANAQAFGLQMGQKLGELNVKEKRGGQTYTVTPPLPHPDFETYLVLVTEKTGLCRVSGIGKTISNDAFGSEVKSTFKSLEASLNSRYGASKRYDFLSPGSIWKEPREWVMAIRQNERTLSTFWTAEHKSALPKEIDGISIEVRALNSSESYIKIMYDFTNASQCMTEIRETSNRGL